MDAVLAAVAEGAEPFALATVVATWSSAPRGVGARMLVRSDSSVLGSLTGGCVEADVHARAVEVLDSGVPQLVRYGVSDEDAGAVGLTCGGTVEIFLQRVRDAEPLRAFAQRVADGVPVAFATVVAHDGGTPGASVAVGPEGLLAGGTGSDRLDSALAHDAASLVAAGRTAELTYGLDGSRQGVGIRVLVDVVAPSPRLIVAGVTDFAAAVTTLGAFLGFRVTLCDARATFATRERFADAHEIAVDWPHRYLAAELGAGRVDGRTVVVVLTHDPKFDEPLLEVALAADLAFVGAMGSRRTHADRLARLRARGVPQEALARLRSPVGLDLGGRSPRETALSIMAEVVAVRSRGSGAPLSGTAGPLHHEVAREHA
ncbi:protein of unknown function DUF182 [Beutenbergia cavernae DSM 12333]|uniref:Xanthine dehydrogenase n=1 Tax=Beutenbergia cavernae (strain ATCC BAA-8 / DSM 12333 / CCUG 43141 / JCM 11478 / NBRC 16432 / NCIMB 13614 / HKI 0122) TaxID=471853 RepID=C5C431_BEUC1|nr:XdhC/CoxI family protein [Beutenbergia cavernae]ACQ79944.1 protein of unknown function DUF182 [Beutenbergia cavernae DSM 12333]